MANISKIKISGTSYNLKDENACNVVELTQAQYDELPTTAKTSNSLFVITDAKGADLSNYYTKTETDGLLDTKLDATAYTPTDLSNYYTKSETSGATEISTALASKADTATTYTKTETDNAITAATSTKQDTLVSGTNIKTINGETLLGEGNITIQGGGGGKAIEAGTNISITTGETADTINCTLPITATTDTTNKTISIGQEVTSDTNRFGCVVIGSAAKGKTYDVVVGNKAKNNGGWNDNVIIGYEAKGYSENIAIGSYTETYNDYQSGCVAIGYNAKAKNIKNAVAIGNSVSTTGKTKTNINNQIKVDDSNQVYIYNKDNTEMICLQDALGGGGSSYTAGDGIDITNDVISVTGKVDTSAFTAHTADTVIHVTSDEKAAWNGKQDALVSGTNIKTINNQSILGEGNIDIQGGGSITIDPSLDSGSTNPVANSAITNAIYNQTARFDGAASYGYLVNISSYEDGNAISIDGIRIKTEGNSISQTSVGPWLYTSTINGKKALSNSSSNTKDFSLVETSAITASVTSSSTDSQVPSAKAVYDIVGNIETLLSKI